MRLAQFRRTTSIVSAIIVCVLVQPALVTIAYGQERVSKPKLILDADTANEIDDLYAIIRTLRQDKLEVLGLNSAQALEFDRDDSFERQEQMGELGKYLTDKWNARFPNFETWTMWDIAAVQAVVHPDMAKQEQVMTPPENVQRKVWVYYEIDAKRMRDDFWKAAMTSP